MRRLPPIDTNPEDKKKLERQLSHDEMVNRELALNTMFTNPHPESLIPTPVGSRERKGSGSDGSNFRSPPAKASASDNNKNVNHAK